MKIYLGGGSQNSTWQAQLMKAVNQPNVEYINLDGKETRATDVKNLLLLIYLIVPGSVDFLDFVDLIDNSNKSPEKTVFCYFDNQDEKQFTKHQLKSLKSVGEMVVKNGGQWFKSFEEIAEFVKLKINQNFR